MKRYLLIPLAFAAAIPARADVVAASGTGFTIEHKLHVAMAREMLWDMITRPREWWQAAHTYSGFPANLSIDPRAGGCWCEKTVNGGSIEHMHTLYAQPGETLRFAGGLGPLQEMPVTGVLTFKLDRAADGGTDLTVTYRVSGASGGLEPFAPVVDKVLGEQWASLKAKADNFGR